MSTNSNRENENIIGKRLREARGKKSLREFAKQIGISHTHLDSIEKGTDPRTGKSVNVGTDTLVKISESTGLRIQYLIGIEDDPNPELVFDDLTKEQLGLLLFADYVNNLKVNFHKLSPAERKTIIQEYYSIDRVSQFLENQKKEKNAGMNSGA